MMTYSTLKQELRNFISKQKSQAFLVCFGMFVLAALAQLSSQRYVYNTSKDMFVSLHNADVIQWCMVNNTFSDSTYKMKMLKNQYRVCQALKGYHKELAITYYANYYAFTICSILFVTLLTIAIFLMTNSGWQNASIVLRTFLMSCILFASIYYFLPAVLKNDANLENNVDKIKAYNSLQDDIMNVFNLYTVNNKTFKVDSALTSHYNKMGLLFDLNVTIDNTKLNASFDDLLKDFNGMKKSVE